MAGVFCLKCFCGAYLGLSILRSSQFHLCHNRFSISSASYDSSPLSHLQGIFDYGIVTCSVSNLGGNRSKFGLGLLDSKLSRYRYCLIHQLSFENENQGESLQGVTHSRDNYLNPFQCFFSPKGDSR